MVTFLFFSLGTTPSSHKVVLTLELSDDFDVAKDPPAMRLSGLFCLFCLKSGTDYTLPCQTPRRGLSHCQENSISV